MTVGLPNSPESAGSGGFARTSPRLPSRLSSIEVSSPQTYEPAPSRGSMSKALRRAEDPTAQQTGGAGALDRAREDVERVRILRADVDVALGRPDREGGDRHPFDNEKGIALHQHPVGESATVALVGVADDILLIRLRIPHRTPFDAGRKAGPAPAPETRCYDLVDDRVGLKRKRALEALEAAVAPIVLDRQRIRDAATGEDEPLLTREEGDVVHPAKRFWMHASG